MAKLQLQCQVYSNIAMLSHYWCNRVGEGVLPHSIQAVRFMQITNEKLVWRWCLCCPQFVALLWSDLNLQKFFTRFAERVHLPLHPGRHCHVGRGKKEGDKKQQELLQSGMNVARFHHQVFVIFNFPT